jgi:hypothetical protein
MKGNLTSRARARMRTFASLTSFGPLLLAAVAAVVVALPAVAQAEVSPQTRAARIRIEASHGMGTQAQLTVKPLAELGQVCNTSREAYVWKTGTLEVLYIVGDNTPMRIENWAGPYYYIAHAEGKPNGEIERAAINQSSCHST